MVATSRYGVNMGILKDDDDDDDGWICNGWSLSRMLLGLPGDGCYIEGERLHR